MEDNDDDDIRLEEEIEIELSKISISSLEADDPDTDLSAEASSDSEPISDELPESVLHYLNFVRKRSQNAERLLQDLENDDVLSDIYSVVPNSTSNCLAELASVYNEDPEELKKRVLSEIEDEELQISTETENAAELSNDGKILSNEIVGSCSMIDDSDMAVSFTFQEVEARCKQEYELWLEKQKEVEDDKMRKLKEEREMEEMEKKIEMQKRQKRKEELEAERMKLEMLHVQQQAVLDDAQQKEEAAWAEQLIQHKQLIQNMHMQIEKEQMAFEEQKANEKQQMVEQQNKAAQKIQASFRAFRVYRSYAPVLKAWRAELKKEKELQETMEREHREKEERLKKRALEKKQEETKSREEKEREELEERVRRNEEYENKKELVRLQRGEKVMLLEQSRRQRSSLKCLTEWKMEPENTDKEIKMAQEKQEIEKIKEDNEAEGMPRRTGTENTAQDMESVQKEKEIQKVEEEEEENKTSKMENGMIATNTREDLEIAKKEGKMEKVNKQEKDIAEELKQINKRNFAIAADFPTQETRLKEEKQDTKMGLWHDNAEQKQTSGNTEFFNEINNNNIVDNGTLYAEDFGSATTDYLKGGNTRTLDIETVVPAKIAEVVQESGAHSTNNSVDVELGSGNTGQTEKSHSSGDIKRELAKIEVQGEVDDLLVRGEISVNPFEKSNLLSDSVEEKRLMWMKTCKSWSRIYSENKKKKVIERCKLRKCSASSMPPLSTAMIIHGGPWNTLQQVTTVTFQDLPGCSLSSLSQCAKLQFLSLRRCGLIALDGFSNCKDLKYIDVEDNNIQTINCENLENLCILILNKNRISSIHGLYGCNNLWNLEFSYNKITRIGGLESLKNLQRLVVNHNQLISTKGLSDSPTLIYIDCSFNHLTHIEGIENCGLLQILKLQGNNLTEFPCLENHVLLRELYLEDNSISAFEKFSHCWLPLLQILSFSQNSFTYLVPLFSYLSLEKLDVSNNCLLDLKSVIQCLTGCHNLRELSLCGNPLLQEENWRCSLLKILPNLKILNGENISSNADISGEVMGVKPDPASFVAFCQAQIKEINLVSKKATRSTNEFCVDAVQRQCWYFKKLMKLSSEHRYAHEYGVVNASEGEGPEKQANNLNQETINIAEEKNAFIAGAKENKQDLLNTPERSIASGNTQPMSINSFATVLGMGRNQECRQEKNCMHYSLNHNKESKDNNVFISPKRNQFSKQIMASNEGNYHQRFDSSQNLAATIIQSFWRGYKVRKEINFYMRLHMAATIIQSFWRSYCIRKKTVSFKKGHNFMDKHKAATVLQALWRGFHLRKKLASALAAVKTDDPEDDYREVNVDDFMFNDAVIQKEWPTLDSARFLSQTLVFTDQLPSPKKYNEPVQQEDKLGHLKWPAQKTWQFSVRPNSSLAENSQISARSEKNSISQFSELKPSPKSLVRSEKEEQISAEWGFKDLATAQLMLKRAHKMKAKKSSSKKIDPAVRLALFKNNENKHPPVKPPKKTQTGKMIYFEGMEEDFTYTGKIAEKMERNKERTYQWLHTQVWDYEGHSPRNEKCKHFLPEIDPEVLKGGRVQLVTSPVRREDTDLELVSVTSGSTLTQNREKNNQPLRHSTGFPKKDAPVPERSQLGPSRKERISFRDHPVQLSGGWGSGKKKAKPLK